MDKKKVLVSKPIFSVDLSKLKIPKELLEPGNKIIKYKYKPINKKDQYKLNRSFK